ncbi:MAG TPA: serine/threonine-protein kinase [Candidatus Krumholzibacteria bacterium]|nr:serine/threonine-protein kinase [Candidatus Krumholzibacteria bacterium]
MSQTRYQRIRAAYLALLPQDDAARERALAALDADLRADVRAMLRDAETVGILDRGPAPDAGRLPASIGPYRVVRRLGRGGMGDVFLAEQDGDLHRRVAVKRIAVGSRFLERFATERRVLARLRHPNIAVVFDAGQDGDDAWLAMEFIDGPPITAWAREHGLDLRARVELVRQVCAGVNHAHGRGVLHRDLKPSNLLVGEVDGQPSVRIIDFGIAKVLEGVDGEAAGRTLAGQILGTPQYMAPEQTELQPELIDARSDTYAIGVVLYELVCGQLPHPTADLAGRGLTELRRILLHDDPPPPSRHDPVVDRELDWICARALARNPDERYQGAGELSADLERWLEGRPVHAAPPSAAYRARKFVRRHALAVAAGATMLVLLVAGLLGTSLALVRARKAEAVAVAESRRAQQTSEFLLDLFDDADPTLGGSRDEIAEWVLRRGRAALDDVDDPALRRTFVPTMGRLYHTLGLYGDADTLLVEALAAAEADGSDLERARAREQAGINAYDQGLYPAANDLLRRAAAAADRAGTGNEARELQANIMTWRASVAIKASHPDSALVHLDAAIALLEAIEPLPWRAVADGQQSRSVALRSLDRLDDALAASDRGLAILADHGAERTPLYAVSLHSRANVLTELDRAEEAVADFQRSRAIWIASYGEVHPHVASSYSSEAATQYALGHYAEMEQLAGKALAIQEQLTSADHPSLAQHLINRSVARLSMETFEGVEDDLLRAIGIYEKVYGGPHPNIASVLDNLAYLYQAQGRRDEALDAYRRCAEMRAATLGPGHRRTLLSRLKLAEVLAGMGERQEAQAIAADILPRLVEVRGPDHDQTRRARTLLDAKE